MTTIYLLYPYDGAEGYNRTLSAAFANKQDVDTLAQQHDTVRDVVVFDNIKEYEDYRDGEVKRRALSKLTTEEKKALGL